MMRVNRLSSSKALGFLVLITAWSIMLLVSRESILALSLYSLLLVGTLLVVLWYRSLTTLRFPITPLSVLLVIFLAYNFLTLFWTTIPTLSVYGIWLIAVWPLAFITYLLLAPSENAWRWFFGFIIAVIMAQAIAAIVAYYWLPSREPRGSFLNQNLLSSFLHVGLLPLCAIYLGTVKKWQRLGLIFLITVMFYTDGLIASRAGLLAFFGGLTLLLLCAAGYYKKRNMLSLLGLLVLVLLLGYPPFFHYLRDQVLSLFTPSTAVSFSMVSQGHVDPALSNHFRWQVLQSCWHLLQDHPFWGVGYAGYSYVFQQYRYVGEYSSGFYAHNDFLQFWIEGGAPAMLLVLLISLVMLWSLWRLRKLAMPTALKLQTLGIGAGVLAIFAHAALSFPLYVAEILFPLGIMMARFQQVAMQYSTSMRYLPHQLWQYIRPWILHVSFALLSLLAMVYFTLVGIAFHLSVVAEKTDDTDARLHYGQIIQVIQPNYTPGYVFSSNALTDKYLREKGVDPAQRKIAYQKIMYLLQQAQQRNRWDARIYRAQAQTIILYYQDLTPLLYARVSHLYQYAIKLEPRNFTIRLLYAKTLVLAKKNKHALAVLAQGLQNQPPMNFMFADYTQLYSQLLKQAGKRELALHNPRNGS